ncbi:MAG: hypothetical protein H0T62_10665 [Parachlamydiaceae bacterium]|nr:hypothetical protein [Parachlamydiaceae bacterium]
MILAKDINKLFNCLLGEGTVQLHIGGSDINAQLSEQNAKISVSAVVYEGDGYIPKSVRKCAAGKLPFSGEWIHTQLEIDEDNFTIFLTYKGQTREFNQSNFKDFLEEFSWQADEWRLYLEEHDKHDLIYAHAR